MVTTNKDELDRCEVTLKCGRHNITIKAAVSIPSTSNPNELAHRLIKHHNLPIHLFPDLSQKLGEELKYLNHQYYCKQDVKYMNDFRNGQVNLAACAQYWGHNSLKPRKEKSRSLCENEELAGMYHSLVHSSNVTNLLTLEHSYAEQISALVAQREEAVEDLIQRQAAEMAKTVQSVGSGLNDDDVNILTARHFEDQQMMEVKWDSEISALKEQQKRDFKHFVDECFVGKEVATPVTPKDFIDHIRDDIDIVDPNDTTLEESFTIHLGAQMKQMHNLRLLSADPLLLCKYQTLNTSTIPPQRIQTSMSLYSHNLNGLVLLVDDRINTYKGIKQEFAKVCGRSTELHFKDIDTQLEMVRDLVPETIQWRKEHPPQVYDSDQTTQPPPTVPQNLKAGDIYITKHSNLSDVHVVFHMIVDDTLRFGDINSRHPAILGLRNVLKVACLSDITTLTVPLLLTNIMSEEMTVSWCQKRAELVYKCVKGFMMEMTSWGGAEMKNMQFLVPKNISDDLFQTLAAMLPSIFRVSNPLVIKSS